MSNQVESHLEYLIIINKLREEIQQGHYNYTQLDDSYKALLEYNTVITDKFQQEIAELKESNIDNLNEHHKDLQHRFNQMLRRAANSELELHRQTAYISMFLTDARDDKDEIARMQVLLSRAYDQLAKDKEVIQALKDKSNE